MGLGRGRLELPVRILTIRRIPIRLHASFLWLAGALVGWQLLRSGLPAAVDAVGLGLMVFGSVILHELGHALVGRLFGIQTRDITLYPFGGVARMEVARMRPWPEIVVSLAGPFVNLLMVGVGLALSALGASFGLELALLNLGLGLFNLLPAYPMDGGRVLRAAMSLREDPATATLKSLRVAQVFAWLFVGVGLLGGAWSLSLVGGFMLLTTRMERQRWERVLAMRKAGALPHG